MKKSLLDYYKEILEKVCFDANLLNKEYQKAIRYLNRSETHQLENWIREKGFSSSLIRVRPTQANRRIEPFT